MVIDILFNCYQYKYDDTGVCTLFIFWPNGVWDENKYSTDEAIEVYPPSEYNWIFTEG